MDLPPPLPTADAPPSLLSYGVAPHHRRAVATPLLWCRSPPSTRRRRSSPTALLPTVDAPPTLPTVDAPPPLLSYDAAPHRRRTAATPPHLWPATSSTPSGGGSGEDGSRCRSHPCLAMDPARRRPTVSPPPVWAAAAAAQIGAGSTTSTRGLLQFAQRRRHSVDAWALLGTARPRRAGSGLSVGRA